MEVALEPPQEASQYLWGGKAGHCSPGKRGCRFCAPLPKHHPTAGEYLRLFTQRSPSEAQLQKILTFFDDHWDQALRYLRKKGMGKHRRGSNSESGMRLLRRLEKNHDGIRSAATRQHYIQIYQAMKYLSLDIAEFIEHGPQMTGPPRV